METGRVGQMRPAIKGIAGREERTAGGEGVRVGPTFPYPPARDEEDGASRRGGAC